MTTNTQNINENILTKGTNNMETAKNRITEITDFLYNYLNGDSENDFSNISKTVLNACINRIQDLNEMGKTRGEKVMSEARPFLNELDLSIVHSVDDTSSSELWYITSNRKEFKDYELSLIRHADDSIFGLLEFKGENEMLVQSIELDFENTENGEKLANIISSFFYDEASAFNSFILEGENKELGILGKMIVNHFKDTPYLRHEFVSMDKTYFKVGNMATTLLLSLEGDKVAIEKLYDSVYIKETDKGDIAEIINIIKKLFSGNYQVKDLI